MPSLVSTPRYLLVAALALIGLSVSAADRPRIALQGVCTADDIIRRLPEAGLYRLSIAFAQGVGPATRTTILNQVFASERARDIVALDLACNGLMQPPILTGLINLQVLGLDFNNLMQPPVLTGLVNLRRLELGRNLLAQPPALTGLINLQDLRLYNNQLTQPPALIGLVNLQRLDLSWNQLTQPPVLTGLVNLQVLDLSSNRLTRPPVLAGLINLHTLNLGGNQLTQPVIIPQQRARTFDLESIGAPYVIERQDGIEPTNLVDIATPGVDTRPWFLYQRTLTALPVPRLNPSTRGDITQTMNLAESWRYWREQGLSAADFDIRLAEADPVEWEAGYTVTRSVAQEFLRERGMGDARNAAILRRFEGDALNVSELVAAMRNPQAAVAGAQGLSDVEQAASPQTERRQSSRRARDPRCPIM